MVDFFDEVLRQYFGSGIGWYARIRWADVERLLCDDTRRRLGHIRLAAMEWGRAETGRVAGSAGAGDVAITEESLLVTPHGLVYVAGLNGRPPRPLYYLATPSALFEHIVDRVGVTPLPPGSAAAVDDRLGDDLTFTWPLDAALRRMLDAYPVLRLT